MVTFEEEDLAYPDPIGPYSVVSKCNDLLFISGQIALVPRYDKLVSDNFNVQAYQVFKNLSNICLAHAGHLHKIIKLTVFLKDLKNDKADLDRMIKKFFINPYPVRSTVEVSALPKDAKIEVDAVMSLQAEAKNLY